MLNFDGVFEKRTTMADICSDLTRQNLRDLTNEMIDVMLSAIDGCIDADVIFEPNDPEANDTYADNEDESNDAWTLGHVIVHTTASSEESAFKAAELARGLPIGGRSRYEVPWETVTTIAQCRQRLEESRRMRLASLDMWPDDPHLEATATYPFLKGALNAYARFALGLLHDNSHVEQIKEIARQAKAARGV